MVQRNKAHKASGKLGKRARKQHKAVAGGIRRPPVKGATGPGSKQKRRQAVKLRRRLQRRSELRLKRQPKPPLLVSILPLSQAVDVSHLYATLVGTCEGSKPDERNYANPQDMEGLIGPAASTTSQTFCTLQPPGNKHTKWMLLPPLKSHQNPLEIVDLVAAAELVLLVFDDNPGQRAIDEEGARALQVLGAIGMPSTAVVLQGTMGKGQKNVSEAKKRAAEALAEHLSTELKIFPVDDAKGCAAMLHHLQPVQFSLPAWRRQRPCLMIEHAEFVQGDALPTSGTLMLTGHVRSKVLSANQLVTIPGIGDYQIKCISPAGRGSFQTPDEMEIGDQILAKPIPEDQQPLIKLNDQPVCEDIPDEDTMAENTITQVRRLPKGTSAYQAAWILDQEDTAQEESQTDDEPNSNQPVDGDMALDDAEDVADDLQSIGSLGRKDSDAEDVDWDSYCGMDEGTSDPREAEQEDAEYPDEVEVPEGVDARVRFEEYRGLKSFRTTPWDPQEGLPPEYSRLFAFQNFRGTAKVAKAEADASDVPGVSIPPGDFVCVHLQDVEAADAAKLVSRVQASKQGEAPPAVAHGLLRHESKMSVVNFRLTKTATYTAPIHDGEDLLVVTGLRAYPARPLISTDDPRFDKHKLERFLHPGRSCVASVYAPITYSPMPILAFKSDGISPPRLAATGTLLGCDPDRVVLRKAVLTGKATHVQKKTAIVSGMFRNPEDVRWFRPVELWTKYGRTGFIREPVGTHGAMKCLFEGALSQRDTVCMSLYKRVFPRWQE
ncbi:unnamed protein product [Ostreobium quekettii]|uniref:Bms1-type G domain-containing protein n=1 Tax=Ostreobium quekettii TaxID=121088 RepID=A0A8S1IKL9_9CHLO|nr:unnamed protein product [Ostreobium quekettii]